MDNFNNICKSGCCEKKIFTLPWFECKRSLGRLELCLVVIFVGNDLQVVLHGGDAHIGATAVAKPGEVTKVITCCGHREDKIALEIANTLSTGIERTACVSAGIHYNNILYEEIESINRMANECAQEALEKLKKINQKTKLQ